MTLFCVVCGGDHQPSATICTDDGMDRQIAKLGGRRWNALTAHVSKINNRKNRPLTAASDGEVG